MNFEAYLTKTIERAVRTAVQEELKDFKEEVLNTITTRTNTRNVTPENSQPESTIIRPKDLANMLSLSISTLYKINNEGKLPPKVKISSNAVGWLRSDIEDWLASRKQAKRNEIITKKNE
jgi:prophage regulatory protein